MSACRALIMWWLSQGVERPLRIEVLSTSLKKGKAKKALLDDVKAGMSKHQP